LCAISSKNKLKATHNTVCWPTLHCNVVRNIFKEQIESNSQQATIRHLHFFVVRNIFKEQIESNSQR